MDRQFTTGAKRCPGTDKCDSLKESRHRAQEGTCGACPRKAHPATAADVEDEREATAATERLVLEKRAGGRTLALSELSPLEWELLMLWEDRATDDERTCLGKLMDVESMIASYFKALARK